MWRDGRIGLIKSDPEKYLKTTWRPVLCFPPWAQSTSFLLSTLNSFQGVSKVSSCGSTRLNPCRGRWVDGKCQLATDKPKAPAHSACVCLSPGWGDRALPGEALETNTATPNWDPPDNHVPGVARTPLPEYPPNVHSPKLQQASWCAAYLSTLWFRLCGSESWLCWLWAVWLWASFLCASVSPSTNRLITVSIS